MGLRPALTLMGQVLFGVITIVRKMNGNIWQVFRHFYEEINLCYFLIAFAVQVAYSENEYTLTAEINAIC